MQRIRKKHSAAFTAKVALAAIKSLPLRKQAVTGPSPSWRAGLASIQTVSTTGRSRCWRVRRASSRVALRRRQPPTRPSSIYYTGRSAR